MMERNRRANIVVGAVIAVVLVAACVAFAWFQAGAGAASGLVALVHDGDGAVRELPLDQDAEAVVSTSLGTNVVVVRKGAVYVSEADCPNLDCVHQGAIDAPGKQIICLPHKLWIEVVAQGEEGGDMNIDAVVGGEDGFDTVAR